MKSAEHACIQGFFALSLSLSLSGTNGPWTVFQKTPRREILLWVAAGSPSEALKECKQCLPNTLQFVFGAVISLSDGTKI